MGDDGFKHPLDDKKIKFRINLLETDNIKWILNISLISFFLSATLSFFSSNLLQEINKILAFCVVLVIIFIGIIFDIIGIAVTAADETPFHAMASRKYYGARQSIILIRNANKVSNFCNDVVGDICGVISGAASTFIIFDISQNLTGFMAVAVGFLITGSVASLTIGGKALGKTFAIENSNYIIYKVGVVSMFFGGKLFSRKTRKKKNS